MLVGIDLWYENISRSFFSFFWIMRFRIGFLPKSLFLICSNWKERASIFPLKSLFWSSSSLTLFRRFRFSFSRKVILFLALPYICSKLESLTSLFFTSSFESSTLTLYHGVWRGVWRVTIFALDRRCGIC